MGKLIVTSFLSLDGVMEAPEKWSLKYWSDHDIGAFKNDELMSSDATLLGRVTYEGFSQAWPGRSGDYADRLNNNPKYAVSSTLDRAEWANSHIVRPDGNLAAEIAAIKDRYEGSLLVHGSCTLVQWLTANGLVDQYNLIVYPVLLGAGKRLFDSAGETPLQLVESRPFSTGATLLVYQREQISS